MITEDLGGGMGRLQRRGDSKIVLLLDKQHFRLLSARMLLLHTHSTLHAMHGCHHSVLGDSSLLLLLVPSGLTAPARQWTESTAATEWYKNGCSQMTETGIGAEHRFRSKAWVSPPDRVWGKKKWEQNKKGEKSRNILHLLATAPNDLDKLRRTK